MFDQILIIISITVLVMISPGPDMVLVLRNTFLEGRRAGMQTSLGILSGNLVHITYCALGIGWVISQSIVAFTVLKYAGAAYLIYLGISSYRSGTTKLDPYSVTATAGHHGKTWFAQGLINNLLNPKGALFYLGVFTAVIKPDTSAGATLVLIAIMMLVSAVFWVFFIYTLDRRIVRRVIERFQGAVNRIFGVLLVFLGIKVALAER